MTRKSWFLLLLLGAAATILFRVIAVFPSICLSWPAFTSTNAIALILQKVAASLLPLQSKVMDDYFGLYRSQIIYTCVRLELAKFLDESPKSTRELTELCEMSDENLLNRLLHAAESFGYFRYDRTSKLWSNTVYSKLLRKDNPDGMANLISHLQEDTYDAWGYLTESIQNNDCPFQNLNGGDLWHYFEELPENEAQFARAMSEVDTICWYGQVHDFQWGNYRRVIDIGGGLGSFLAHILEAYPGLHGALFDRTPVIDRAVGVWVDEYSHLQSRVTFSSGSFFEAASLPAFRDEGDVILMRNIFHDWNDTMAVEILRSLRLAIGLRNVSVALVEMMLSDREWVPYRHIFDLHMHVVVHGKERDHDEWLSLLDKSGFQLIHIVPTRSLSYVLVAKPAR